MTRTTTYLRLGTFVTTVAAAVPLIAAQGSSDAAYWSVCGLLFATLLFSINDRTEGSPRNVYGAALLGLLAFMLFQFYFVSDVSALADTGFLTATILVATLVFILMCSWLIGRMLPEVADLLNKEVERRTQEGVDALIGEEKLSIGNWPEKQFTEFYCASVVYVPGRIILLGILLLLVTATVNKSWLPAVENQFLLFIILGAGGFELLFLHLRFERVIRQTANDRVKRVLQKAERLVSPITEPSAKIPSEGAEKPHDPET